VLLQEYLSENTVMGGCYKWNWWL